MEDQPWLCVLGIVSKRTLVTQVRRPQEQTCVAQTSTIPEQSEVLGLSALWLMEEVGTASWKK